MGDNWCSGGQLQQCLVLKDGFRQHQAWRRARRTLTVLERRLTQDLPLSTLVSKTLRSQLRLTRTLLVTAGWVLMLAAISESLEQFGNESFF